MDSKNQTNTRNNILKHHLNIFLGIFFWMISWGALFFLYNSCQCQELLETLCIRLRNDGQLLEVEFETTKTLVSPVTVTTRQHPGWRGWVDPTIWVFPKIGIPPQIIHVNKVFHYKPSILGYHYFGNIHMSSFVWGERWGFLNIWTLFFGMGWNSPSRIRKHMLLWFITYASPPS